MKLLRCYNNLNTSNHGSGVRSRKNVSRRFQKLNLAVVIPVVVGLLAGLVGFGECGLPLSKPCGEVNCQGLEYCSQIDHTCQSCKNVCDEGSHNYDENRCSSDCQDYIHDERYLSVNSSFILLKHIEMEEKYKNLEDDVFVLKVIVGICVAVIFLVVAILAAFLVYFWKLLHPPSDPSSPEEKTKKKGSTKSASSATNVELPTVYNNRYGVTTPTPENSPSPAETSASNVNTSFTSIVPPSYNGGAPPRRQSETSTARASPETVTTTLTSAASTFAAKEFNKMNGAIGGGLRGGSGPGSSPTKTPTAAASNGRFRREPSESTLPDNCAYDNLSMSPQHHVHYSHHV